MKTIYYYQTFVGLSKMLTHIQDVDVIIVSSLHFGKGQIYLNDNLPNDKRFDQLWLETKEASVQGCKIMLMMGGAGLAYRELFSDFNTYYPLLKSLIEEISWISGIDIDVEENTTIENIQLLIRTLVRDFGEDFTITMAPIAAALQSDGGSISGINYKKIYQSSEGKYINWFNTQCYDSFSIETYKAIIQNGYPPNKIVMGMESGQFNERSFKTALSTIKNIKNQYPDISGIFDWEYLNAPPNQQDPSQWASLIKLL
jgi:chitinase